MKIEEFADVIQKEIIVRYYPNQNKRWCAKFDRGEIKDGSCLSSTFANGETPSGAVANYAKEIAGKEIVFDAIGEKRMEFFVPKSIAGAD